jgi:glycosyltransferase involved in cell wall biosynthesis
MAERFRIVHLATTDAGGVGRSASRLHASLLALGHDSSMLVRQSQRARKEKETFAARIDLPVDVAEKEFAAEVFQRWYLDHNRTPLSNSLFTLNEAGLAVETHPLVQDADIIHLHSVARFLSPGSIARLAALGKPVVWSMHDMRPFTGGCHFSAGCTRFTSNCAKCPQLEWDPFFITEAQLAHEIEIIPAKKITYVAPTEWLAQKARTSALLKDARIQMIPYGIETHLFPSRWKPQAKGYLGLDTSTTHLLFVANKLGEMRKGFESLARSIEICLTRPAFKAKADKGEIALISLGHPHPRLATLGIPYVCLGYLESHEEMSQLYGAADLFLQPSLEENASNTLLEAMSSGTPPIAFGVGGIPEFMVQDQTGKLAPPGSVAEFAAAIELLIFDEDLRQRMGENARAMILEQFDSRLEAERYTNLYVELMAGRSRTARSPETFGFTRGKDFPVTKLAPMSRRLEQICLDSLPKPLQRMLTASEQRHTANEHDSHELKNLLEVQQDAIESLQTELDEQRGVLRTQETTILKQNKILGSSAIKMLRQLKLINK